jgi:hypothetical protein
MSSFDGSLGSEFASRTEPRRPETSDIVEAGPQNGWSRILTGARSRSGMEQFGIDMSSLIYSCLRLLKTYCDALLRSQEMDVTGGTVLRVCEGYVRADIQLHWKFETGPRETDDVLR